MAVMLSNNASSTLSGSINTAVTVLSINADDATRFPSPSPGDWFPVTLIDSSGNMEIMRCTGRSGGTLTVLRAQEGTTAKAFPAGGRVDLRLTAAAYKEVTDTLATHADTLSIHADALSTHETTLATHADTLDSHGQDLVAHANELMKRVSVDSVQSFTAAEKGQAIANIGGGVLAGFRDKIINGDGQISQRTYTTVADDVYWCDRHYVLTQTAAITPTIITDVANGLPFMMRLTQSQATAQRMGNAQIVEAAISKRLRGKQVTLGGKLRCSASQVIRFAVLEWTGTADLPTSDVVASWTNGAFTAGNFFLGSNLTVAAVGTITPTANTLTDWSLTANISSACNNIIVMMWTEGTAGQSVTLDMVWGLIVGDATTEKWPYDARHFQQELALCQRYYEQVAIVAYEYHTNVSQAAGDQRIATAYFKEVKRATPSATLISAGSGSYSVNAIDANRISIYKTGVFTDAISAAYHINAEL